MTRINALPNYFNGKLYKKWDSVHSLFGENGILAAKTDKNNTAIELLITDKGQKRELLKDDEKIMDTIDTHGVKRTYHYERSKDNQVKGQMRVALNDDGRNPLVVAAKWVSKNLIPEKLILKLDPNNKLSKVFIPAQSLSTPEHEFKGLGKLIQVEEVLAKDFEPNVNKLMPKTLLLKTNKGSVVGISSEDAEDNISFINHFDINSDVLGHNIRTVV